MVIQDINLLLCLYITHIKHQIFFFYRKEYTHWRTDHSVALQCHCCYAMFSIKHVGKANLLADNANVHTMS